ncbi:MAG TPA: hypothetical protein ENL46_07855 [Candidatus Aminicenantes bacterium]|nr:hypothetical protein [Candidatus Aminicenantes bacterium]
MGELLVFQRKNKVSMNAPLRKNKLKRGLPMVEERDMHSLEREKEYLNKINTKPYFWQRWFGYWNLSGPGWIQSALTLGAGSAGSAIFAGSVFGYRLLLLIAAILVVAAGAVAKITSLI